MALGTINWALVTITDVQLDHDDAWMHLDQLNGVSWRQRYQQNCEKKHQGVGRYYNRI